jgi:hydroxyacylglutathione hydrolase
MIHTIAIAEDHKLKVQILPMYDDNYAWVLHNDKHAWVIDPGQGQTVIECLKKHNLALKGMLITHCHWDHVSGIDEIQALFTVPVYGTKGSHRAITHNITEGTELNLDGVTLEVWSTPGHMADHLSYYCRKNNWLFCGDTLFSIGCGRIKQTGNMQDLFKSTQRFKTLPPHTLIFCSHEYTQNNLAFAATVEPDNTAIGDHQKLTNDLRSNGKATIPSTLATELACNPFLRLNQPTIISSVQQQDTTVSIKTQYDVFKGLREWKDRF